MSDIIEQQKYCFEYYKSKFSHDYDNGNLIWKFKDGDDYGNLTQGEKMFNGKYAGKVAGHKEPNGYIVINIDGEHIRAHRIIYLFMTGEWPEYDIDHINGDPSDNRWENLRAVNRQGNCKNQKIRKNNTSGITGVDWHKHSQKWNVRINNISGKRINLGKFDDFFEACCRRKSAEIEYDYHKNHGTVR